MPERLLRGGGGWHFAAFASTSCAQCARLFYTLNLDLGVESIRVHIGEDAKRNLRRCSGSQFLDGGAYLQIFLLQTPRAFDDATISTLLTATIM